MTIVTAFHQSGYRDFKIFYINHVLFFWESEFPTLISYTRMLKLMQSILVPLSSFLPHQKAHPTGIAFIDSTKL